MYVYALSANLFFDFYRAKIVFSDRRSSHGNPWISRRISPVPIPLLGAYKTTGSSSPMDPTTAPIVEERNVEEMGARYLKARGKHKRHTVHGSDEEMAAGDWNLQTQTPIAAGRQYSPMEGYYSGGSRHVRTNPVHRQQTTVRRGSDSTQLTPDMLRHLGNLYCTAVPQKVCT